MAIAALLGVELAIIVHGTIGPSLDEGIYLMAGARTLEGHGIDDGYLAWFAGSLLWPVVAGLGDRAAGLGGARAAAALFVTIGVIGTWRATIALFGRRAGFFAALAALAAGPVLALGHLGVIDAPAVAGMGIALWAVTALALRDDRTWLAVAAVAFSFGVLAKYPAAGCAIPLLALLVALRRRRAPMDVAMFALIVGAILMTYYLSQRSQLGYFAGWRARNNPTFGVTLPMLVAHQVWYTGPSLLLAIGGWLACRRKDVASALLAGALVFPAYHLGTGANVGSSKHAVFGLLFTLPLIGLLLSRLARHQAGLVVTVVVLAALGGHALHQVDRLDRNFIDIRPAAAYLATAAHPGDDFLIDNSWPFIHELYAEGKIATPWRVFDVYRIEHHQQRKPLCRFDWFVAAQGGGAWPDAIRRRMVACGTFRKVFAQQAPVTDLNRDLQFTTWPAGVEIYRNTRGDRDRDRRARSRDG
jgi:hypothetical protein